LNLIGSVTSKIGYRSVNDCYDAALTFIESKWLTINDYFNIEVSQVRPSIIEFHNTESSSKIGKYYYTVDESSIWQNEDVLIKHLHFE
jgi:hypothetical protein